MLCWFLTLSCLNLKILYIHLFTLLNLTWIFLLKWRISFLVLATTNKLILFLWNIYLLTYLLLTKNLRTWRSSKLRIVWIRILLQRSSDILIIILTCKLNCNIAGTLLLKDTLMRVIKWIFRRIKLRLISSKESCIWLETIIYDTGKFFDIQMIGYSWAIHFFMIWIFINNFNPIFIWLLHFFVFTN